MSCSHDGDILKDQAPCSRKSVVRNIDIDRCEDGQRCGSVGVGGRGPGRRYV